MQVGGLGFLRTLATGHLQAVLFDLDLDFRAVETGHGHRDAVGVLAGNLDVVGGVAWLRVVAHRIVQHAGQTVEANGGAVQRSKIKLVHGFLSSKFKR